MVHLSFQKTGGKIEFNYKLLRATEEKNRTILQSDLRSTGLCSLVVWQQICLQKLSVSIFVSIIICLAVFVMYGDASVQ